MCEPQSPTNGTSRQPNRSVRTPQPRWYFDADIIGVGKLLAAARRDVTWPGDDGVRGKPRDQQTPCVITDTATPDHEWIPKVTASGLAIITRDKRIQTRTAEIAAVEASGARMFAVTSEGQLNRWELLEVVVTRWRDLESACQRPGPFIFAVTRSGIRALDLF